jgi:hypothetical protein
MQTTRIVDALAVALVAGGAASFAMAARDLAASADLNALEWSLAAIFVLRAASSLSGPEARS